MKQVHLFLVFLFIPSLISVCIEKECPYFCCIDNDRCNPRPDCLLETSQFCSFSEDCLSGCCHGRLCRPDGVCSDYVLTTGLTLGLFFLIILLCICVVFYRKWSFNVQRKERIKKFGKMMVFGQALLAKKIGMLPLLFKPNINKKFSAKNVEENIGDEESREKKEFHEGLVVREAEMIKLKPRE